VESALLSHPAVLECGVIAAPDEARGNIVEAHVVLAGGYAADADMVRTLQDHVKNTIAPYKYPRSVRFITELPKTATGKVQRFRLRSEP
jgi:2-aminobenzoate-CoA ligase